MSNVERRYAYLDEGVFPEEGEYGVTYLTLYSSNAGNTYDGWVYDPYNKVRESLTERTYGYRNPDYPQYCWDDEVVVDLSNAQSRQESSEYIQGRITSFNTNVSDRPIILQDIDITGLTEEERENRATTVLFSAIPLVQDAYIQAQVEVQCKCNLSPNNTSGEMRIEAFYILNDESDRTMRPNPVHTFAVANENERHTLPWLYWNPALRHDDHNYIGVKLICTGGTAEIGISDNPDYGDAMITLASAGLTGDHIDTGHPVSLEIFGKEEVVGGYELDPNDYTVLCTYDTGEIYEVTRMCTFTPEMGTRIEQAFTTLTAHYQGLSASMTIRLGMVESIELTGVDEFHNKLKLKLSDYTVFAYLDTGDIMDVTAECTFSPAMGTTISADTTLVTTYSPYWMHGASFTDSINIEKVPVIAYGGAGDPEDGLVYSLCSDGYVVITGNATHPDALDARITDNEIIRLPQNGVDTHGNPFDIHAAVASSGYTLEWAAEGKVGGYESIADPNNNSKFCKGFVNFNDVEVTSVYDDPSGTYDEYIQFDFSNERDLTSNMLRWCGNVDNTQVCMRTDQMGNLTSMFYGCRALTNVDFISNWNIIATNTSRMFEECISLKNIDGLSNLDMSQVTDASQMFYDCHQVEDISGSANWDVGSLTNASSMFLGCESLTNVDALFFWSPDNLSNLTNMFGGIGADHISGIKNWDKSSWRQTQYMLDGSKIIDLDGLQGLDLTVLSNNRFAISGCDELINLNGCEDWVLDSNAYIGFTNCDKLVDISALSEWDASQLTICPRFSNNASLTDLSPLSNWDVSNIRDFRSAFRSCSELSDLQPLSNWDTSSATNMSYMFYGDDKVRYIGCLSGWNVLNIVPGGATTAGLDYMFARSDDDAENNFANTHIIDAGGLNWSVPTTSYPGGVEPLWICTITGVDMFYGTDYPTRNRAVPLSEKLYSLPYWYYHNNPHIDETR